MRNKLSLFLILLIGLIITSCAGGSSQQSAAHPSSPNVAQPTPSQPTPTPVPPTSGIRVLLRTTSGAVPATLASTQDILAQRLTAFGFKNASVQEITDHGQPALQIEVPHFAGQEKDLLATLLGTGQLAFWDTGAGNTLQDNTSFDPDMYARSNGGSNPLFTGADLDPAKFQITPDRQVSGSYAIGFAMRGAAAGRLNSFTGAHIGDCLTITLDRKVIISAVIQSNLPGEGVIAGFTHDRAQAIVSVLKYTPLPIALQISSETNFW